MKFNIEKLKANTVPYNELSEEYIKDPEFQKEYLNLSLEEYSNLYTLFNGEKVPRLDTIAKILKELGYTIRVA